MKKNLIGSEFSPHFSHRIGDCRGHVQINIAKCTKYDIIIQKELCNLGGAAMELRIDGMHIVPKVGQTLLELIRELKLDCEKLSCRPLAAKIAGEVFTLNYIPLREKED